MSTLTRAYTTLINAYAGGVLSGRDERQCEKLRLEALNVIRDRLFIAQDVAELDIAKKWSKAVSALNIGGNWRPLEQAYPEIAEAIRRSASKIMM